MRYDSAPALEDVYQLIAALYEDEDQAEWAMIIADALVALGEDRSWASVWWAYGVIHHDLSDSSYKRALELLEKVDRSSESCAAALMLRAEIESTRAIERADSPEPRRQFELLSQAVDLAPDWPNLHLRMAHACVALGDEESARRHAWLALEQLDEQRVSKDPFDSALSGGLLDKSYVREELGALGLPQP
jgi:tetratricopeptide (TPR) repeat protein